jgi:hypothetical protein
MNSTERLGSRRSEPDSAQSSAGSETLKPLLVRPRIAWMMLGCGNTRGYELLAAGELECFLDGGARKITVASIHRYIQRHLARQQHRAAKETNRSKRRAHSHRIVRSNAD